MRRDVALLISLLFVAACATGVRMTYDADIENYRINESGLLQAAGGVQLVLLGNPFGADNRAKLTELAARQVEGGSFGAPFQVIPLKDGETPARTRVVMAINSTQSARELCTAPPANTTSQAKLPTEITVAAAFCRGERRVSSVSGRVGGITGVDDPRLALLLSQVASEIFPSDATVRDLYYRRDDGVDWYSGN